MSSTAVDEQPQPPPPPSSSFATNEEAPNTTFIRTTTNSYVSRGATLDGPKFVELKGRIVVHSGVRLHGDRAPIRIGRYGWLERNCVIEPPSLSMSDPAKCVPVTIGAHTVIGEGSTIQAAAVGSMCWVGRNVQAKSRCILKDCCFVEDNTVIPADTVVPPFHRAYTATDGRFCTLALPPAVAVELQERAIRLYHEFAAAQRRKE